MDCQRVVEDFNKFLKNNTVLRSLSFGQLRIVEEDDCGFNKTLNEALTRSKSSLRCVDLGGCEFYKAPFHDDISTFQGFLDAVTRSQLECLNGVRLPLEAVRALIRVIPSLNLKELRIDVDYEDDWQVCLFWSFLVR